MGGGVAPALTESLGSALDFLARSQEVSGCWRDFHLPTGQSDEWVTGYVTSACALGAGHAPDDARERAHRAAQRGGGWLHAHRHYRVGWGYNGRTGQDADSTGWALQALDATGVPVDLRERDFLAAHWDRSGGVRTYLDGPDGWGGVHCEVTPVAVLGLGPTHPDRVRAGLAYSAAARLPDGSWPSYWWHTTHYSTMLHVELRAVTRTLTGDERPVVTEEPAHAVRTSFDLACIVATAAMSGLAAEVTEALARELVAQQLADGSWPSSPGLRVTDPRSGAAGAPLTGTVHADGGRTYTTATAVRALAWCLA